MRTVSQDLEPGLTKQRDQQPNGVADPELERYLEHLTDAGLTTLLEWAKRHAPDLLRTLMISYIGGQSSNRPREELSFGYSAEAHSRKAKAPSTKTLRVLQQEHVIRVVSQSRTLAEAAARLGIHSTTLWRKLKHYKGSPP